MRNMYDSPTKRAVGPWLKVCFRIVRGPVTMARAEEPVAADVVLSWTRVLMGAESGGESEVDGSYPLTASHVTVGKTLSQSLWLRYYCRSPPHLTTSNGCVTKVAATDAMVPAERLTTNCGLSSAANASFSLR